MYLGYIKMYRCQFFTAEEFKNNEINFKIEMHRYSHKYTL